MKLTLKKLAVAAAAVAVVGGGTAAFAAASAPAAVPVVVGHAGEVGYEAETVTDTTYYTHESAYFGLGNPQYGPGSPYIQVTPLIAAELKLTSSGPHSITSPFILPAAARIGFSDGSSTLGYDTAQLAIVPLSTSQYDVLAVYGKSHVGLNGMETISSGVFQILLRNVPAAHTLAGDVLFDGHLSNSVRFVADDLGTPGGIMNITLPGISGSHGEFYQADSGMINDTDKSGVTLTGTFPAADSPSHVQLRMSHVLLDGNQIDGPEVHGTLQSNTAWTATAFLNETSQGQVLDGVSVFASDHYSVYAGA